MGLAAPSHGSEQRGEVELPLVSRSYDAGEDLLGVGVVAGAIAITDFPGDHRGAYGVFRAPVGRVDRRVPEEGEGVGESRCRDARRNARRR